MGSQPKDSDWSMRLQRLHAIASHLCENMMLGDALHETQSFLDSFQRSDLQGRLDALRGDYDLLSRFYVQGFTDPKRTELYYNMVEKLYKLLQDIANSYEEANSPQRAAHTKWKSRIYFETDEIRNKLEGYVSEVAFCSLEPAESVADKLHGIHEKHFRYLSDLFDAVTFSYQWSGEWAESMGRLLCSPTIDSADAQLLTTALTLSCMTCYDPERLKTLIHIYKHAADVHLRERALVGWLLSLNSKSEKLYPQTKGEIDRLLANDETRQEVMETQMQIVFCRNAKRDNEKLKKDIMPGLLKNNDFKITPTGIKPKEEDTMDDILNPEAAERKMEEMEESIQKMADMHKQGADIYFGGFSQMKRYSFFYTLINWFLPFTPDHPQLSHISAELLKSSFLKMLTESATFCESDKYSFVLGISGIFHQLPPQVKEAMDAGPMVMSAGMNAEADPQSPVIVRRMYLQDLYRFFTLCDERRMFANPFDNAHFLFLRQQFYFDQMSDEVRRVTRLLYKMKQYDNAYALHRIYATDENAADLRLTALLCSRLGKYREAAEAYKRLVDMEPDNAKNHHGLAQAYFLEGEYAKAVSSYKSYFEKEPDDNGGMLNYCIALICNENFEEALQILFRLHYEQPDNLGVKRALAYAQMHVGRNDQAEKLYEEILADDERHEEDYLNAAYCQWFQGKLENTIKLLCKSVRMQKKRVNSAGDIQELMTRDYSLLLKYNIQQPEINIVTDRCFEKLNEK